MAHDGGSSPKKIFVLISGSGSNLQALIDACDNGRIPNARIVHVVSDRKNAYGLKRAEAKDIPTTYHGILPFKKRFPDDSADPQFEEARRVYDEALAKIVLESAPDIVVCAGFMRIVTPSFLEPLQTANVPIINLHPSLYGDLVGAHCIEDAWKEFQAGKRSKTGIMVHFVITDVDKGAPILQQEVDMRGCATLEDLQDRIHKTEHGLIVDGTAKVLAGDKSGP